MTWNALRSGWYWPMPASGSCCFTCGRPIPVTGGNCRAAGSRRGESYLDAAVREIREETGLRLDPVQVGPPDWRRDATWHSRGVRRLQHEVVVLARVAAERPDIIDGGRTATELEDYVESRWWEVDEILSSTERFYPGRLPWLLPAFLAGQIINEPFERWN